MTKNFLWQINGNEKPQQLSADVNFLERHLEDWIKSDPNLLQPGLQIVGCQLQVIGGRLDLLGLDPNGRFVVIEIKQGSLYRETIAQGLDYVACIGAMPAGELETKCDKYLQDKKAGSTLRELLSSVSRLDQLEPRNREVFLYVVGTKEDKSDGVDRISQLLKPHISVSSIFFQIYAMADGQRILLRERIDSDDGDTQKDISSPAPTLDSLTQQADSSVVGPDFRKFYDAATAFGLYPRLYKFCVMFAPQRSKNRVLFTVWTTPVNEKLKVYVSAEAIAEFFPISIADATALIGADGFRELDHEAVDKFLSQLKQVFDGFKKQ